MSSTVPEECPKSQNQSRQASEEPSQAAATPPRPPVRPPPIHEASSPPAEQIDYGDDADPVVIVTISTDTRPLEPVVETANDEPVPTHADPITIQPAQEQPSEYVQSSMPAPLKPIQVIELELSEESASSSRNSPAQQHQQHTSPSASPEQQNDQTEDYPQPSSSYSYQEDIEKEAKKTPRGVRGRSARPNSGTATPVTSGKKTRGRGRKARGGARISELAAEAIQHASEDIYTFRATPDSEVDPYDRETSVGPTSKKGRFETEEIIKDEYDQEEDDDNSRNNANSSKKVPKLRILLPAKQPSEEEAETPPAYTKTKNLGIRGKMGKRGADNEEQRITRSKSDKMRQNAKHLDDDDNLAVKKKRTRISLTPMPEEPPETLMTRPIERQITPIPEALTEGQKLLYMVPLKGCIQLKKKLEARWQEDCKIDSENLKKSTEKFSNLLLNSEEERAEGIKIRNGEYEDFPQHLPKDMQNDPRVSDLLNDQYQERKELFKQMKIDRTRLQLTYEQEYSRMIKRREGTAPLMSFTRIQREEEVLNPLFIDAPPHKPPLIDESAFCAKIEKKTHHLFTEHKMDCNVLYAKQREQWRGFFRKKVFPDMEKVLHDLVLLVPAERLVLDFV